MSVNRQDIEAELSYAYLHAVSAACGFECCVRGRIADKNGIDAQVTAYGEIAGPGSLTDFAIEVQLKATYTALTDVDGRIPYRPLKVPQYDKLRNPLTKLDRFVVLLHLPPNPIDWIRVTPEQLVARNCAYWVSLRNAPASNNPATQTVYFPRANLLDVDGLSALMKRVARQEVIDYGG